MVKSLSSVHGISKGHNFCFITPNLVPLFLKLFSWHELSKSFITFHKISSHNHVIFQAIFGGKFTNLKSMHHGSFLPLPMCLKDDFEWLWSRKCYCSRPFAPCTMQNVIFGHNTLFWLITTKPCLILISMWLVKHINRKT